MCKVFVINHIFLLEGFGNPISFCQNRGKPENAENTERPTFIPVNSHIYSNALKILLIQKATSSAFSRECLSGIPRMACCQINAKYAFWHLAGVNLRIYLLVGVNQRQMRFLAFGGFSTPILQVKTHEIGLKTPPTRRKFNIFLLN